MKFKYLAKSIMLVLMLLFCTALVACNDQNDGDDVYNDDGFVARGEGLEYAIVVFHYQRNNGDYDNWNIWVWNNEGIRLGATNSDSFGVYYKIDLGDETKDYYQATKLGYIFHKGEWEAKDTISKDRFVSLTEAMLNDKNEIHLYSFEGVETMYLDKEKNNPICEIKSFTLSSTNTKQVEVNLNTKGKSYTLFRNNEVAKTGDISSAEFTVTLPEAYSLAKGDAYKIVIDFGNNIVLESELNYSTYYDTDEFKNTFIYDGDDLGVTIENGKTTFKVWSPGASAISLQTWNYGHYTTYGTAEYPGDDTPVANINLTRDEENPGVWSVTVDEDLTGMYYTYTATIGFTTTKDIVDPYAWAAGLNGMRGYIVDFSKTNPTGWSYNYTKSGNSWSRNNGIPYNVNELVIYELHVRDLTMDDTWNGTEAKRGKYLGLSESGTTYTDGTTTVTTGFDHIKELGVNAVQILPFFDQYNDETSDTFNWGYNPQNYNVLEGQYSSNPYDAEARIKEFKEMVMAYQEAGIVVIMDVVYNHMNGISGSSFDKLVPGYFFRYNEDGSASNGSGCGNETDSRREMFNKYMIDSTKFWITEYNLAGFRFDLMGLHDYMTMNEIAKTLHDIDPNIAVYGEPWEGGTTTLTQRYHSDTANVSKLEGVAIFNDAIRDGIKGGVFTNTQPAWVQGSGAVTAITNSMDGLLYSNPTKQINYVTCHDNNTLTDKLRLSGVAESELADANVLAQSFVLTSEGITFLHAGEEILRSKPIFDAEGNPTGEYSHNSYNLPDSTNAIKWDEKITNIEVFNKYKELIAINREHALYQLNSFAQCSNYKIKESSKSMIVAEITRPNSLADKEDWSKVTMIYTNKISKDSTYTLTEEWKVAFVSGETTLKVGDTVTGTITAGKYAVIILYK
jgi:pullulanase